MVEGLRGNGCAGCCGVVLRGIDALEKEGYRVFIVAHEVVRLEP